MVKSPGNLQSPQQILREFKGERGWDRDPKSRFLSIWFQLPWFPTISDPQTPFLSRFYLIAGGIPLIICGITAAVNIHNYRDHSP